MKSLEQDLVVLFVDFNLFFFAWCTRRLSGCGISGTCAVRSEQVEGWWRWLKRSQWSTLWSFSQGNYPRWITSIEGLEQADRRRDELMQHKSCQWRSDSYVTPRSCWSRCSGDRRYVCSLLVYGIPIAFFAVSRGVEYVALAVFAEDTTVELFSYALLLTDYIYWLSYMYSRIRGSEGSMYDVIVPTIVRIMRVVTLVAIMTNLIT